MSKSPNLENSPDDLERKSGLLENGNNEEPLALGLSDEAVLRIISKRVETGEAYWNSQLNLDEVRKTAEDFYLGHTYNEKDLYDFQVPYKNNRILTAVETLLPMATSRVPQPIVTEGQDTDESRNLAYDLRDVLLALYEDLGIKYEFQMSIRHVLEGMRVGILKYYFNPDAGERLPDGSRKGAIVVESIRPTKIVFDEESSDPDNIALIAEYKKDTIEQLVYSFPNKKEEIFKHFGIVRGTKSQLARKVGYEEVWFTYLDGNGDPQEAVAWVVSNQLVLDAKKNPNWNYDEFKQTEDGKYQRLNFFDAPKKPYILINHINTGKYVIDDTSLADQAQPLQKVLEKRGRQIVENADQAASGLVLNSDMISVDDAAKIIGDPTEKIMVGGDVRSAATRLPYNILPAYVINDKADARNEIDNIFGANASLRGEATNSNTLGQEILSQRSNAGRMQTITNSLERAAAKLYPALVQMMKVYWDEPEIVRYNPSDGNTRHIEWKSDKIEDGVKVRVKDGSATPKDKTTQHNETIQTMAVLDPLTIAEGLDYPEPKKIAKRIVHYRFFMDKYLSEDLADDGSEVDSQAVADIQALLGGQTPPVPDSPSKKYIATFDRFLNSGGFQSIQDVNVKQNVIAFAKAVNDKAKTGIGESPVQPQSENNPAAPEPAEEAGVVPSEGAAVAGTVQPATAPGETVQPRQNIFQRLLSKVRGQ